MGIFGYQDSNKGIDVDGFWIESFSPGMTDSIETLMWEIEPAFTEKTEFENRDDSKASALLGKNTLSEIWSKHRNE